MADIYVRTRTSGGLNDNQRYALRLLDEWGEASIGGHATGLGKGKPTIHVETAFVLVRGGYAQISPNGVVITEKGERKARLGTLETPSERKRRTAAAALKAQETGEWVPAPAGASAAATRDAKSRKEEWIQAHADLTRAREAVRIQQDLLRMAKDWSDSPGDVAQAQHDLEQAEGELVRAKAGVERLKDEKDLRAA